MNLSDQPIFELPDDVSLLSETELEELVAGIYAKLLSLRENQVSEAD